MAKVSNLTVEAGGEAVLRCTSSTSPTSQLVDLDEAVESQGTSNTSGLYEVCNWELNEKEIELSSTRHSLSSSDESHVSMDHLTQLV